MERSGVLERRHRSARFAKTNIDLGTVHCWICAATLEGVLASLPGVLHAVVHPATARIEIRFDPAITSYPDLRESLVSGGFLDNG